jgi:ribonuclease HI
VKINLDASLNLKDGIVGLGCVTRNDEGLVVQAKCCACNVQAGPLLAEAMAALFAIDFCKEMGFSKIVSEGDSLQVIKGICDPDSPFVCIGHYVETIRQKASEFSSCSWVHCCREANDVAHVLARQASSKCLSFCWVEEIPSFISVVSHRDFSVSRL